ncbi:MAG: hypothetical protein RR324_02795 [Cellulosilyticaceae bacterium]
MKKLIGLLSVVVIIILGGLTYLEADTSIYEAGYYGGEDKKIYIENPFEVDTKVKELLKHINSVNQKNNDKEAAWSIHADRTGAVSEISIRGAQLPECKEQVEKIERVLELDGMVEYIYGEEQVAYDEKAYSQLSEGEEILREKQFGDVFVTVEQYKSMEKASEKYTENNRKSISVKILRDKLTNPAHEELARKLEENGYYLVNLISGGAEEMLIFNNISQLNGISSTSKIMDENGEILDGMAEAMRYEILAKEGKVSQIRYVAQGVEKLAVGESDIEMFLASARELGLDESQLPQLRQVIEETLAKPMKDRKEKIGGWEYQAKYSQRDLGQGIREIYLDITLR